MRVGRLPRVGLYNLNFAAKGGGERRTLVLAEALGKTHEVLLFAAGPLDLPSLEGYFGVDLSRVTPVALGAREEDGERIGRLGLDLFVNNSYESELACPARRGVYMCMFPHAASGNAWLDSYAVVTANSRFTRDWIRRRWRREASVVYSPCDAIGAGRKGRRILAVGRFGGGGPREHLKRQDVLVEAFRGMPRLHDDGWRLDLAGSSTPGSGAAALEGLRDAARGAPVDFHPDADRAALVELYRGASVFWHATGFGAAAEEEPSRVEHFGVSVVEAMSASAVPVVFDAGGPRETVRRNVTGFRFRTVAELQDLTHRLVSRPLLRRRLAWGAALSSRRFRRSAFVARVLSAVARG